MQSNTNLSMENYYINQIIKYQEFSPNTCQIPKVQNFGLYCKYQLLRYKPWKNKQDDSWENQPKSNDVFISQWKTLLQTDYAKKHVSDWHRKLETYSPHVIMCKLKIMWNQNNSVKNGWF